jgi:hypothetical protein
MKMAFTHEPIVEKTFQELDEVISWAEDEQKHLVRVPIYGILEYGGQFLDDEYFGDDHTAFQFNQSGIRSFCSIIGMRLGTLELLERQNLATDVLNDLLAQQGIQEKFKTLEFIIDESKNVILGIVSNSYVGYSNFQLLQDIKNLIKPKGQQVSLFPQEGDFVFKGAYSVNTRMSLRFTMKKKVGVVKGLGGEGVDETELGFQLKNSMVGDSSVNINFFLHRKICANGLVSPAGSSVNRVFHSGKEENFSKRLENAFGEITRRIGKAGKMIEDLGCLEFNPELLARTDRSEMIFDILQGSKGQIVDAYSIPNTHREGNKGENKIQREAEIISHIPDVYGGELSGRVFKTNLRNNASMFDFVNIFTEYAKKLNPAKKIEAEEKAGVLADWVAKNKRKFNSLS